MFKYDKIILSMFGIAGAVTGSGAWIILYGKILNDENNERNKIHREIWKYSIWSESYWKDLPDRKYITNQIIKYNKQLLCEGRRLATNNEIITLYDEQGIKTSIELKNYFNDVNNLVFIKWLNDKHNSPARGKKHEYKLGINVSSEFDKSLESYSSGLYITSYNGKLFDYYEGSIAFIRLVENDLQDKNNTKPTYVVFSKNSLRTNRLYVEKFVDGKDYNNESQIVEILEKLKKFFFANKYK